MIIRFLLLLFLYTYGAVLQADGGLLTEELVSHQFYSTQSLSTSSDSGALTVEQSFSSLNNRVRQVSDDTFPRKFLLASNHTNNRALKSITYSNAEAESEARHALVIGNSNYIGNPLANPQNDASAMAQDLEILGFKVTKITDAKQEQIYTEIRKFGRKLTESNGVGLFYYAGHAMQIDGLNYMLPVDINLNENDEKLVRSNSVDVDAVLKQMKNAENSLNIVILDSCRNNPFPGESRSLGSGGGLAQIDAPSGTFISYSTAPGQVAADGDGDFSPFTGTLLKYLRIPNLKIEEVFKEVRKTVIEETGGKQIPWESSSLVGDFYFSGGGSGVEVKASDFVPIQVSHVESPSGQEDTLSRVLELKKSWYKRWYVWAGIIGAAYLISCGSGESATADSAGSSGC